MRIVRVYSEAMPEVPCMVETLKSRELTRGRVPRPSVKSVSTAVRSAPLSWRARALIQMPFSSRTSMFSISWLPEPGASCGMGSGESGVWKGGGAGCLFWFGFEFDAGEADSVVQVDSVLLALTGAVGHLHPILAGAFAKELETPAALVRRPFRHSHVQTADADRVLGEEGGDVPGGGRGEDRAAPCVVVPLAV